LFSQRGAGHILLARPLEGHEKNHVGLVLFFELFFRQRYQRGWSQRGPMGHIVIKIVFPITKIAQIFFGGSWVLGVTFKLIKRVVIFFDLTLMKKKLVYEEKKNFSPE
jgi:hypothetical protein